MDGSRFLNSLVAVIIQRQIPVWYGASLFLQLHLLPIRSQHSPRTTHLNDSGGLINSVC